MKKYLHQIILIAILALAIFLRFFNLSSNPPSLYWEEAALGYDAYSILKTGKDFHGNSWPLVAFESFGDYKPSVYFYAAVPSVAVFGLTPLAVRFPSAVFGSLTVLLIYFLAKYFFSDKVALISALFLAISPWHLQLSRAGFEANLGLFFVTLGTWLFFKALKNKKLLVLSVLSLVLSMYTYHANRVFVPLLGLSLGFFYLKKLLKTKTNTIAVAILFFLLITPLIIKLANPQVSVRFQQTSAFATLDPIIKSNQLIKADGGGFIPRLIHHRYWQYTQIFFDHYLDHFSDNFLFLSGDINPRHSTQAVGSFYFIQLPLLLWGVLLSIKQKKFAPLFIFLLLAPVPAALTKATPHALRSLALIIPLTILSAYGLTKLKTPLIILVSLILIFELNRYLFIYHKTYPQQYSDHWQYGYQELIEFVNQSQGQYDHIYITREHGRPSIYYWFYSQTDPALVQQANDQVLKDQGEYLEFQNITFSSPPDQLPANSLFILGPTDAPLKNTSLLKEINNLSGQLVFRVYET